MLGGQNSTQSDITALHRVLLRLINKQFNNQHILRQFVKSATLLVLSVQKLMRFFCYCEKCYRITLAIIQSRIFLYEFLFLRRLVNWFFQC